MDSSSAGYLLRSKPVEEDEGGFIAGVAAIDTPLLVSDDVLASQLAHNH